MKSKVDLINYVTDKYGVVIHHDDFVIIAQDGVNGYLYLIYHWHEYVGDLNLRYYIQYVKEYKWEETIYVK